MNDKILPPGLSGRGGITLIIFTVLATLLFFIPEILTLTGIRTQPSVSVERRIPLRDSGESSSEKHVIQIEEVAKERITPSRVRRTVVEEEIGDEKPQIEPDAEIEIVTVDEYQQGELSGIISKIKEGVLSVEDEPYLTPQEIPENRRSVYELFQEAKKKGGVSWKNFRNREVKAVLEDVERQLLTLVKSVGGKRYPQSNKALIRYLLAVQGITKGEARTININWYLGLLEESDRAVTKYMNEEGVSSALYQKWLELSLVPLIGAAADRLKLANQPPLRADVVITEVQMRKVFLNGRQSLRLTINGVVVGEDSDLLKFYRNRRLVKEIQLGSRGETKRFSVNFETVHNSAAEPRFTIRILDQQGRWIAKDYRLIGRIAKFPQRDGSYVMPRVDWDGRVYESIPRRIDNYLRVGPGYGTGIVEGDINKRSTSSSSNRMVPFASDSVELNAGFSGYSKF